MVRAGDLVLFFSLSFLHLRLAVFVVGDGRLVSFSSYGFVCL